jgi:paraquat-inducible protein B
MSDHLPENIETKLPKAVVKSVNQVSSVWLIPIIALLIGAWMVFDSLQQQGPRITIAFDTAQGIEANESLVKLRDIPIGKVVDMRLNAKLNGVILTVSLNKNTESLLTKDSQFWVVKPRIGFGSVSGLSTLLSGAYIELAPGRSTEFGDHFLGLENPPLTPAGTPGLHLTLDSNSDHAFDIGDPVLFRGSKVGRIEYKHFNFEERKVYYNVFIDAPYDQLITTNTRFWEVKGIEVDLSAEGVKVNTGTLETFLDGGIAFDVPSYLFKGEQIIERAYFSIYPNKETVNERLYQAAQNYILLFSQNIRGLKLGAMVEFKGVKVGKVIRTDLNYPELKDFMGPNSLIPVMINIAPGRLGLQDNEVGLDKLQRSMLTWVAGGLHGVMANDNLLTGSKYIDLRYIEHSSNMMQRYGDVQMLPTADSEWQQLFGRVQQIVATFEQLPLANTMQEFEQAMQAMKLAMAKFNSASTQVTELLQQTDVPALINQANQSLSSVQTLADSYAKGSATNQQLNHLLQSLEQAIQVLNPLLLQLKLRPNSLIFSGSPKVELQPTGKNHE